MKKIIILFCILLSPAFSDELELNIDRIDVVFPGLANSNETVVAYGTGSMILYTTDLGKTWSDKKIYEDSTDIQKMLFNNNRYIGILNKDYCVTGSPDAENWQVHYTGIGNQQSLAVNDSCIYILSDNTINIFNVEDYSFKAKIVLDDTNKFRSLYIFKNYLLAAGDRGRLLTYDLENDYKMKLIDFIALGFTNSPFMVYRFKEDNNKLFISLGADILSTDDLTSWTKIISGAKLYEAYKGNIYDLYADNTKYLLAANITLRKLVNNVFTIVTHNKEQRNVDMVAVLDYKFINDSTLMAVGRDKLIAISNDTGHTWNIASYLVHHGAIYNVNDSIMYSVGTKGRISRTLNDGVTWQPALFTSPSVKQMIYPGGDAAEFYEDGTGFVFTTQLIKNYPNLLVTYDYGNSYEARCIDGLNSISMPYHCNFFKKKDGYNVVFMTEYMHKPVTDIVSLDTAFNFIDEKYIDSIQIKTIKKIDDNRYFALADDMKWPYFREENEDVIKKFLFMHSDDLGQTWETDFDVVIQDTSFSHINIFDNLLYVGSSYYYKTPHEVPNINQLYLIDMNTLERTRIFNDILSSYDLITEYDNTLFLDVDELLYFNKDYKKHPLKWDKFYFPQKRIRIDNFNNKIYGSIVDLKTKEVHYYRAKMKIISSAPEIVERKTYLYTERPYPNPANNIVRTKIYWDVYSDIEQADIIIYDYLGNKIDAANTIEIKKENDYTADLTWNCSTFKSGYYIIFIKLGNIFRSIPVIVN